MKQDCEFCQNEFSHTVIKDYDKWQIQIFLDQCYLGRTLVKLKRHAVDLTELRQEERSELFETVLPELKEATDNLFDPDLYNQATLGNDCRHFHLHLIPRYKDSKKFNGETFRDENWNSDYKPYPEDFELSEETLNRIREELIEEIG